MLSNLSGMLRLIGCTPIACLVIGCLSQSATADQVQMPFEPVRVASAQNATHQAVHKPKVMARTAAENAPAAYKYPDDLTSLRVNRSIPETSAYRFTSNPPTGGSGEYLHTEKPAWNDSSPASPSYGPPSVRSVVLSTIGGIAVEHGEHGGHGHDRDYHLLSK